MAKNKPITRRATTTGEDILFAEAEARLDEIFLLIQEFKEIVDTLSSVGYGAESQCSGWEGLPWLEVTTWHRDGGHMVVEDVEFLEEYRLDGPRKKLGEDKFVARTPLMKERIRLGRETNWKCFYCGEDGDENNGPDGRVWHVDHAFPFVHGGDDRPDNHVLACATCNLEKKARTFKDFFLYKAELARREAAKIA